MKRSIDRLIEESLFDCFLFTFYHFQSLTLILSYISSLISIQSFSFSLCLSLSLSLCPSLYVSFSLSLALLLSLSLSLYLSLFSLSLSLLKAIRVSNNFSQTYDRIMCRHLFLVFWTSPFLFDNMSCQL